MTKQELQETLRKIALSANAKRPTLSDIIDSLDAYGFKVTGDLATMLRIAGHSARMLYVAAIAASDLIATAPTVEDGKVLKEWDFTKE